MKAFRRLVRRLIASVLGRRGDERLHEELAEHLSLLTEEHVRAGLSPDEAGRRARLALGAHAAIADAYRDEHRLGWLEDFRRDVWIGLRSLCRAPGFSAAAIVTLALGIGANLAVFAVINAVLIRPLPFREPGDLMLVHLLLREDDGSGAVRETLWSYPKYEVVRDGQRVFTSTALFAGGEWSLSGVGHAERIHGEVVEPSYFPLLGVDPLSGRPLTTDDDRVGAPPVAVISHGLRQRRFGSDMDALGKVIAVDGTAVTVVGVMPPGFRGLSARADIWRPMKPTVPYDLSEPFSHSYRQLARRRPGTTIEQADSAIRVLGAQIDAAFPVAATAAPSAVSAVPLNQERIDPLLRRAVFILLGATGLVLLMACVNLATLSLARGAARRREVAIRLALGAGRGRVVRQFLTESLCLSFAGAVVGAVVATASIRLASSVMPDLTNVLDGQRGDLLRVGASMIGFDGTLVLATLVLAAVSALFFGLLPAWQATLWNVATAVKATMGGDSSTGLSRSLVRHGLVVAQLALALVVLASAALMATSVMRLNQTDLGFQAEEVLTFQVALPGESYPPDRMVPFIEQLLATLKSRSEVTAVAFGHCPPVSDRCNGTRAFLTARPAISPGTDPLVGVTWVSPDYFDALGVRILRGRSFTDQDRQGQPKVVVVNESAAKQFWPSEDPIGRRIGLGQGGFRDGAEVIGVAADVRYASVEAPPGPDVYIPVLQSPRPGGLFFVKSELPASTLVPMIRQELASLDRSLPLADVKTMDERYGEATWRTWTIGLLLSVFATVAVGLTLVGVFALVAQSVAQRRREIGLRMALGAVPRDIRRLVLRRSLLVVGVGVVLGLGGAWFASRLLTTLLYDVGPNDPIVLSSVSLFLFVVALVASYLPAERATRIDPAETMRPD
jgi:putative ABC transport system permease protein